MKFHLLLIRITLLLILSPSPLAALAQKEQAKAGGKPQAGQETNCEGALEIVPRKEMSFVRKRRPATGTQSEKKPASATAKEKSGE
jgi:hypothetical protein